MVLKFNKQIELLWRVLGGNVILTLLAILQINKNPELSSHVICVNILLIAILAYQAIKRELTLSSEVKEILKIYAIARLIINYTMINTEAQSVVALLSIIVESIWIIKFYLQPKKPILKRGQ